MFLKQKLHQLNQLDRLSTY